MLFTTRRFASEQRRDLLQAAQPLIEPEKATHHQVRPPTGGWEHNGPVREIWERVGIDPLGALAVVVAATALYFIYVVLMRLWGRQLRSSLSVFSVALVTVMGSIAARAMLGNTPTLAGGVIALLVLVFWERVFRRQSLARMRARIAPNAELLMVEGQPLAAQLAKLRFPEQLLWTKLRQAGITSPEQIGIVILEANGAFTIVRSGNTIDARMLETVAHRELIPDHLVKAI